MYCKKCGTKQTGGYKYCPKCGTPFSDERVEDFENVSWDDNKKQTATFIKKVISNPNKIGIITKVIACLFAFAFCIVFVLIVGLGTTKDNANYSLGKLWSSSEKGPHEICIHNDATIIGNKGWMKYDIIESEGNYDIHDTSHGSLIVTDIITIPKGEKWKFDRDESTCEGVFYSPQVCLYHGGDEKNLNNYQCYTTEKTSNMPIFRGGDKIVIKVPLSIFPDKKMALHLKVYFIETNDEFAM